MKKIIIFRLDDVCPSMDKEKFERVVEIFNKYDIKPLLGIVPDNKDIALMRDEEDVFFWKRMNTLVAQGYDIAMHGYQHIYDSDRMGLVNGRMASEFAGHPYAVQEEKIKNGKMLLKKQLGDVDVFFAPGHSYDHCTVEVLYRNGFKWISDGRSHWGYQSKGIKFIPCRTYEISVKSNRINTVCIHTNNLSNETENKICEIIENNRDSIYSFREVCEKFEVLAGRDFFMKIDEKLYVLYERYVRKNISPYYQRLRKALIDKKVREEIR